VASSLVVSYSDKLNDLLMVYFILVYEPLWRSPGGLPDIQCVTPIYRTCANFLKYPIEFYCTLVAVFFLDRQAKELVATGPHILVQQLKLTTLNF